jgi:hypothetical protein
LAAIRAHAEARIRALSGAAKHTAMARPSKCIIIISGGTVQVGPDGVSHSPRSRRRKGFQPSL